MAAKAPYYRGVRGSAALATRRLDADAPAAEGLEAGEMRRLPYGGELLGAVRVRAAYAALPLDAFDRAGEALDALEQAAYLHLLRLSVGEGRNWCRAAKRDLLARLRLSERRLLRVLDALVVKGFAKPLHRDNRGTLWRVYLPREAFGERLGDDVLVGRATDLRLVRGAPDATTGTPTSTATPTVDEAVRPEPFDSGAEGAYAQGRLRAAATAAARSRRAPTPTPSSAQASTPTPPPRGPRPVHTEVSLGRALAAARGSTGPEGIAAAIREVRELLGDGQRAERIAAGIETVRRRATRAAAAKEPA